MSLFPFVSGQILSAENRIEPQQAITLNRIHLSLLTVTGTAMQLCRLLLFTARPALSSQFAYTTLVNYCVNVHSEHLQLNWEY